MSEGTEWVTVHDSAVTNADPDSMVRVTINTDRICPNMTNRQFADVVTRARDAGVALIKDRIAGVGRWDKNEQARARIWRTISRFKSKGVDPRMHALYGHL